MHWTPKSPRAESIKPTSSIFKGPNRHTEVKTEGAHPNLQRFLGQASLAFIWKQPNKPWTHISKTTNCWQLSRLGMLTAEIAHLNDQCLVSDPKKKTTNKIRSSSSRAWTSHFPMSTTSTSTFQSWRPWTCGWRHVTSHLKIFQNNFQNQTSKITSRVTSHSNNLNFTTFRKQESNI